MSYLRLRQDPALGEATKTTQPAKPVFRIECPAGCAPIAAGQCRNILRRAIRDAINLANNAASKLEASPVEAATKNVFRFFFGHLPSRPVPWGAGNDPSGAIVARRLRIVARALQSRGTLYRCAACTVSTVKECPLNAPAIPCPLNARTLRPYTLNTIELCPRFWSQSRMWRAGILLHEMLHLYFGQFFRHHPNDPERRRDNAHCYEAFALRVAGHAPDQCDICRCRRRPA